MTNAGLRGSEYNAAGVPLSPSVAGETNVQDALEAVADSISSPLDIPGCVLWLDATDPTTINAGSPSDGDPVSSWADKSPSGYDATQATADRKPVYKTDVQNGLAVVRFDGVTVKDQYMDLLTGGALLQGAPGLTLLYVSGNEDAGTNYASVLYCSIAGDPDTARFYVNDNHIEGHSGDGGNVPPDMAFAVVTTVAGPENDQKKGWTSSAWKATAIRLDWRAGGVLSLQTSTAGALMFVAPFAYTSTRRVTDGPVAFEDTPSELVRLGSKADLDDSFGLDGDLSQVIVYNRAITARETRLLMEFYSDLYATI